MTVSFCQSLQLVCPQCARSFPFDLWLIIDLVERPDLTERLRAGTLHTVS
ncbi:MAG: hypothetical protein GYA30_12380, partial [Chloroflexi bacterium]|nr:hypothetical protein [Chloroflexota bacterium]